jgi:alpha-glucosidase
MTAGRTPLPIAEEPHHDGSELYRSSGPHSLGGTVRVRLRVPSGCGSTRVRVRSTPDAEPLITEAHIDGADADAAADADAGAGAGATWWSADLVLHNPVANYRFLLEGGSLGYAWVNAAGLHHVDVTDDADFRVSSYGTPPSWLSDAVGYQIFIDRFARSGASVAPPPWAIAQDWDDPIDDRRGRRTQQWYGGDLGGVEQHLDHLEQLGVDLIYLTPFFPAGSAHRYDAATFDHVDPVLGGDAALISLIRAAHARGLRIIGDITLNHTGARHDWFRAAQADPSSIEAGFYMFGDGPDDYVAWHGVRSLPKLDHRSRELARRLHSGTESVVGRFLEPPFGLDGWRVDCANTTARYGPIDENARVARETRSTLDESPGSDRWLLAEHCYDPRADLDGAGWHGTMAYQWFSRPLWSWLSDDHPISLMSALDLPLLDGVATVASMRHLAADVPWEAQMASMTLLDSHDTARFRTVVGGDRALHELGVTALLTMPGVPTVFAGSEVGVEGASSDTARVPFPWDESTWDRPLLDATRTLIEIRRNSPALRRGSLRWLDARPESMTFVREVVGETMLVHLARTVEEPRLVPIHTIWDAAAPGRRRLGRPDVTVVRGAGTVDPDGSVRLGGAAGSTIVAFRA